MDKLIGYAIGDVDGAYRNLNASLRTLVPPAVELQDERGIWDYRAARFQLDRISYKAVHAPIIGVDLTDPQKRARDMAIFRTKVSMDLADWVGAQTFVLHPAHSQAVYTPQDREERRQIFLDVFRNSLVPHYIEDGHTYKISFENVEHPKYPSTLAELVALRDEAGPTHQIGFVLDVPQLWNTYRALGVDGIEDMIQAFLAKEGENVSHVHIANIVEEPVKVHAPLTEGDIHPLVANILPILRHPVILEVYGADRKTLHRSRDMAISLMERK